MRKLWVSFGFVAKKDAKAEGLRLLACSDIACQWRRQDSDQVRGGVYREQGLGCVHRVPQTPRLLPSGLQESSSPCVQVLGLSLPGRLPLSWFPPLWAPPLLPLDERAIVMPASLLSVSVSPAAWHWPIRVDPGGRRVPEAPAPWGEPLSSPGESEGRRHGGWWGGHLGWREDGLFAN